MNMIRWNPHNEPALFHNHFNRLFDTAENTNARSWNPAADVYETDTAIVINAELPGVNKDNISVDLKEGILTLKGERSEESEEKKESVYRKERRYGRFERAFRLPEGVKTEAITADYKDGVLKIGIPKPEAATPRTITVH